MKIDTREFFAKVRSERDGRDVLVSPVVFWDVARQLNAKVELFAWDKAGERGTEIIRVTTDEGPFLLVSDPDVPADQPHYAKVSP